MLHFAQTRGLDATDYGLLKALYYGSATFFELPTGVLADRLGRRGVLVLAALVLSAGCVVTAQAWSFTAFAVAELLFGVGMSLSNAADSALLHDALAAEGRTGEYARAEGIASAVWLVVSALGLPLSDAFLVRDGDAMLAYAVSAGTLALGALCALAMREAPRSAPRSAGEITRGALRDVREVPGILRLVVYSIGVFVLVRAATISFYNPALAALGVPVNRWGSVLAVTNVLAALAAWSVHRAMPRFGERTVLLAMPLALVGMYVGLAVLRTPWAALLFGVQGAAFGAYPIVLRSLLNRLVPSPERRATVLSFESMAIRIAGGLAVVLAGWSIDAMPLSSALLLTAAAGCIPFACVPFLARAARR